MIFDPSGDQVGVIAYLPRLSLNTRFRCLPLGAIVQITPAESANRIFAPLGDHRLQQHSTCTPEDVSRRRPAPLTPTIHSEPGGGGSPSGPLKRTSRLPSGEKPPG